MRLAGAEPFIVIVVLVVLIFFMLGFLNSLLWSQTFDDAVGTNEPATFERLRVRVGIIKP